MSVGFIRSKFDSNIYFIFFENIPIYLLIYVDNMLLISKLKSKIDELKEILGVEFDMKDLRIVKKILGMVIDREKSKNKLKIHQST